MDLAIDGFGGADVHFFIERVGVPGYRRFAGIPSTSQKVSLVALDCCLFPAL